MALEYCKKDSCGVLQEGWLRSTVRRMAVEWLWSGCGVAVECCEKDGCGVRREGWLWSAERRMAVECCEKDGCGVQREMAVDCAEDNDCRSCGVAEKKMAADC
jgi:hypothetical protein